MRTEMTSEAATAARPSSTAAPAGLSAPSATGSARWAAAACAAPSISRMEALMEV